METQNVTLSIPKEILRKAKILAVRRKMSLSGLLSQTLESLVSQQEAYAIARSRHRHWLAKGSDLGTNGEIRWSRDELHGR